MKRRCFLRIVRSVLLGKEARGSWAQGEHSQDPHREQGGLGTEGRPQKAKGKKSAHRRLVLGTPCARKRRVAKALAGRRLPPLPAQPRTPEPRKTKKLSAFTESPGSCVWPLRPADRSLAVVMGTPGRARPSSWAPRHTHGDSQVWVEVSPIWTPQPEAARNANLLPPPTDTGKAATWWGIRPEPAPGPQGRRQPCQPPGEEGQGPVLGRKDREQMTPYFTSKHSQVVMTLGSLSAL